jgi:hypothetical protein
MAKANLSRMNVEELMALRTRVDEMLLEHRAEMQKQLERMDKVIAVLGGEGNARTRDEGQAH